MELKRENTFQECVQQARDMFDNYFINSIVELIEKHPEDERTAFGKQFWIGE